MGSFLVTPSAASRWSCRLYYVLPRELHFTAIADRVTEVFGIRFIDKVWNATLTDQNSTEFRSLASQISKEVSLINRILDIITLF